MSIGPKDRYQVSSAENQGSLQKILLIELNEEKARRLLKMKRSEAINSIWECIACQYDENYLNRTDCNKILTTLEDLGLTAPSYFEDKGDYGLILKQGWEPEGNKDE